MACGRALNVLLRSQGHQHCSLFEALSSCCLDTSSSCATPGVVHQQPTTLRASTCPIPQHATLAPSALLSLSAHYPGSAAAARGTPRPPLPLAYHTRGLSTGCAPHSTGLGLATQGHQRRNMAVLPSPVLRGAPHLPKPSIPQGQQQLLQEEQQGLQERSHLVAWKALAMSHTRRPSKATPISQGLAFLESADQLSRPHLERSMAQLAQVFADNAHAYSLEEVCAWSEICRRLDFPASDPCHAEAARGALEGRASDLEPHQLPSVLWLLASGDAPLAPGQEEERALVAAVRAHAGELGHLDLLDVCESVSRLGLTQRDQVLAAHLSRLVARRLPSCTPLQALRLAGSGVTHALPYAAPERALVLSSLCAHLAARQGEYDDMGGGGGGGGELMGRALRLVTGLAAGQPALQEAVRAVQRLRQELDQHQHQDDQPLRS